MENMLTCWMQQTGRNQQIKDLQFVQFMKDRAYHPGIKTQYKTMFSINPKFGLTKSLTREIVGLLHDEEDLNKLFQKMEKEPGLIPEDTNKKYRT